MKYVALLRGINVGGKTPIKMADLKQCFEKLGFKNVRTYINSGNVLFEYDKQSTAGLSKMIEQAIEATFSVPIRVVVIDEPSYRTMMRNIPKGWGKKPDWKYNMLFLIQPYDIEDIMVDVGELKPSIEMMEIGDGIIYQAMLFTAFGKTTTGKLVSKTAYKRMTIRNWNTAQKLAQLLEE